MAKADDMKGAFRRCLPGWSCAGDLYLRPKRGTQIRDFRHRWTSCGETQFAEGKQPPGLKPHTFLTIYAALKGRSSTGVPTFIRFSASC